MTVIFTDIDGTLLDATTRDYDAVRPALDLLEKLRVPVVLSTSKTRAEVEEIRNCLGNRHPFIVENGGAVFVPKKYFALECAASVETGGYDAIELGAPYEKLVTELCRASRETSCRVRAFHSMTVAEVAARCSLNLEEARRAKQRRYDEPFQVVEPECTGRLLAAIDRRGLRWTQGGSWYHLAGNTDKAIAARALLACFQRAHGAVTTVGMGDASNDAALLSFADAKFIVRSPLATAVESLVPDAHTTKQSGTAGWKEAVLYWLGKGGEFIKAGQGFKECCEWEQPINGGEFR